MRQDRGMPHINRSINSHVGLEVERNSPPDHPLLYNTVVLFVSLSFSLLGCVLHLFFCPPLTSFLFSSFLLLTNSLFFSCFLSSLLSCFHFPPRFLPFLVSQFVSSITLFSLISFMFPLYFFPSTLNFHLMPYALSTVVLIFISAIYSSHQILFSFLTIAASHPLVSKDCFKKPN